MSQKQVLGRGLEALMGTQALLEKEMLLWLDPQIIIPNTLQPRMHFDEEALTELAHSISQHGVLQPLLVQEKNPQEYTLIAGERRLRAAKQIGLTQVPCRLLSLDEQGTLEVALLENIQRDDLNALDEAQGYHMLIERFSYTQEALAKRLGKSRSHITNRLRLLSLPETLKTWIREDRLSAGHAKVLLSADNPERLAQDIIKEKLSVRATEERVRNVHQPMDHQDHQETTEIDNLERQLTESIGYKTKIQAHSKGETSLSFTFPTLTALEDFIETLYSAFKKS